MKIEVDLDSAVPVYEQVRSQLVAYVDAGILRPGDRLPSIRQLANDLGVATNTVQRAYRELESDGFIRARGRHGTVVLDRPVHGVSRSMATREMRAAADRLAHEVASSGGGIDDVIRLARSAFLNLGDVQTQTQGQRP